MPRSSVFIGAVESHRFLVDPGRKELSCSNGIPLQGPPSAVVSHDAPEEIADPVCHLVGDITTRPTVSRQVSDSLQKLLKKQERGPASLFPFHRSVNSSRGARSTHAVLTVYPLKIVSLGEGTSIVERTPALQTDQAYAVFAVSSANPSTAQGRFSVGADGAQCSNGGASAPRTPLRCRQASLLGKERSNDVTHHHGQRRDQR